MATSVGALRDLLTHDGCTRSVRRATVVITRWDPPLGAGGWTGRLGHLPVRRHSTTAPLLGSGRLRVRIVLTEPVSLRRLIAGVLPIITPTRPLPDPASADVTCVPAPPAWAPALRAAALPQGRPEIRGYDVLVRTDDAQLASEQTSVAAVSLRANHHGLWFTPRTPVIAIDTALANPIGRDSWANARRPAEREPSATLTVDETADPRWMLTRDDTGARLLEGPLAESPSSPRRRELIAHAARLDRIFVPRLPGADPAAEAVLLAQLAATGAVCLVAELADRVADLLDPQLRAVVLEPPGTIIGPDGTKPDSTAEPIEWELRGVRQRRAALRGHGGAFVLGRARAHAIAGSTTVPSVSVVLATRRPDYLRRMMRLLAAQAYPCLEIVLCAHGLDPDRDLPPDFAAPLRERGHHLVTCRVDADTSFGAALGIATGAASGSLITKFDDDDVYGPEHIWDLVLAREFSGAALIGKAAEFVRLDQLGVTVRRRVVPPERYATWVAGGTMLIARGDLEQVGGWRPVPRSVDLGLIERVLESGGLIYRTHAFGYLYERRGGGHTWDTGLDYFLRPAGQQWRGMPPYAEFAAEIAEMDALDANATNR